MPLFHGYTVSFIDAECEKICIDFLDTLPNDYERNQLLRFFRKYKKETYVEHAGNEIFFVVVNWTHWVEFLFYLGFDDTARAMGGVLSDLYRDTEISLDDWITQLKQATPVKEQHKDKGVTKISIDEEEYALLKQREIRKLRLNKVAMETSIDEYDFNIRWHLKRCIPLL